VSSIWLDRHASTSITITGWTIARSAISAASALGGEFAGVSGLDGGIVRIGRWLVGWRCVGYLKSTGVALASPAKGKRRLAASATLR